jgi:hypothetical protein
MILNKKLQEGIMDLKNFETMDNVILYGIVNMKLRDEFPNLDELCAFYDISKDALIEKLHMGGYKFDPAHNHFMGE